MAEVDVDANIEYFLHGFYSRVKVTPQGYRSLRPLLMSLKDVNFADLEENPGQTPEQLVTLIHAFKEHANGFEALRRLTNFKPTEYLHSFKDAEADCKKIAEESGIFEMTEPGVIKTKVTDITMYDATSDVDFNFGDFDVYMRSDSVICSPRANNTQNADGFYHPYMSLHENVICFGEHQVGYKAAMGQGRFYDAFEIVKTVLSFYGGDDLNGNEAGPHMALFNWAGQRCGICDEVFRPDKGGFSCQKTQEPVCVECGKDDSNKDAVTKLVYLPMFLDTCKECEIQTINIRGGKCTACRSNSKTI